MESRSSLPNPSLCEYYDLNAMLKQKMKAEGVVQLANSFKKDLIV